MHTHKQEKKRCIFMFLQTQKVISTSNNNSHFLLSGQTAVVICFNHHCSRWKILAIFHDGKKKRAWKKMVSPQKLVQNNLCIYNLYNFYSKHQTITIQSATMNKCAIFSGRGGGSETTSLTNKKVQAFHKNIIFECWIKCMVLNKSTRSPNV